MADVLEGLEELLLLRLTVLLLHDEAVEEVFLGEFCLAGGGVDGLFDDTYLAVTDRDGDEVEKHLDVLPQGLVGLAGDPHPIVNEGELLSVFAVVDHRIYLI